MDGQHGEFTCANCGETYLKERSDDDAMAAAEALFDTKFDLSEVEIICDDCHIALMSATQAEDN